MRTGFAASASAHALLVAFGLLSLGAAEPLKPEVVDSIAVDLVPITDFSNIRAGSLESKVVETPTPAVVESEKPAELAKPTGNTEEDQPKPTEAPKPSPAPPVNTAPEPEPVPEPAPLPEPPKPQPAPEPAPAPAPKPTPAPPQPEAAAPAPELAVPETPQPPKEVAPQPTVRTAALEEKRAAFKKQQEAAAKAEALAEQKKKDEAKAAAAAEQKKKDDEKKAREAKQKQQAEKHADQVANIINNESSRGAVTGEGGTPTLGKSTGQSATLSQTQIDALVAQIKTCLNTPAGAEDVGATTTLQFSIDAGGNVVGQPQMMTTPTSQIEDAYARAALRAVMRCGPYAMAAGQDVSALFNAAQF